MMFLLTHSFNSNNFLHPRNDTFIIAFNEGVIDSEYWNISVPEMASELT